MGKEDINNSEFVKLLYRAKIRKDIDQFVKPPFSVEIDSHSTATHVKIFLIAEGKPPLNVWYRTNWSSPSYEFNDRGRVIGIQPGYEFVKEYLASIYESLLRHEELLEKEKRDKKRQKEIQEKIAYDHLVEEYKGVLKQFGTKD